MEKGYHNILLEELESAINLLATEIDDMFGKTQPLGYKKPSEKEMLDRYMSITPEMDDKLMAEYGQPYQDYKLKMADLYARRQIDGGRI